MFLGLRKIKYVEVNILMFYKGIKHITTAYQTEKKGKTQTDKTD